MKQKRENSELFDEYAWLDEHLPDKRLQVLIWLGIIILVVLIGGYLVWRNL